MTLCLSACAVIGNKPDNKNKVIIPPSSATITSLLTKSDQHQVDGQILKALITLERAIQIEPADPVPWYQAAWAHFSLGDYNQTIDFAQRAAALSSLYPSLRRGCWRLIAQSHQQLGQQQQARLARQKADTI